MKTAQRIGSAAAAGRARLHNHYAPFLANHAGFERRSRCPLEPVLEPVLLECNLVWGVADESLELTAHRGCHPGQEHLGRLTPPMGES